MIVKVLAIVIMFAVIVLVHEWGHFILAKKNNVLVHEFAIGMGPKITAFKKGETLYSIRLFPIGGFCQMESETGSSDNPRGLSSKKPYQKILIFAAGAFMNFILAWLLMIVVVNVQGYNGNRIGELSQGLPAQAIGMQVGDRIIAIDGVQTTKIEDIKNALSSGHKQYNLTVEREGKTIEFLLTPQYDEERQQYLIGFVPQKEKYSFIQSIGAGASATINLVKQTWMGFVQMVTGKVSVKDMAGVVGVVQISSDVWEAGMKVNGFMGAIMNMFYITAILSANLCVLNLLPIPALDGSRILFAIIEAIRGKALDAEKEGFIHFIGFVLLMFLMVIILYNDITRWWVAK